jgi:hypothetical protein
MCISRNPAAASGQTCMELIAIALSKLSLSNGRFSTERTEVPLDGLRRGDWLEAIDRNGT